MYRYWIVALVCCFPPSLLAQDRVTFLDRSGRASTPLVRSGTINAEDPAKLTITTNDNRRQAVPSFDILDVQYEAEPAPEMNAARGAERDHKWDAALAAYGDALRKTPATQQYLRRHLEFKLAELRAGQADAGGNAGPAIDALRAFLHAHPDARQALPCLDHLGRLLVMTRQPATEVVQGLTQLRATYGNDAKDLANRCDLLRIDLLSLDLDLTFAKEGAAAAATKASAAAKSLADMARSADRSTQADLAARQAYCQALAGALPAAQAAWEGQLKASDDPRSRAATHLARGDYLRLMQKYRDAMWDYLWVDTVYFTDREQQAQALYHLIDVFEKLGDTPKSRESRERLLADTRLKDTRYQKLVPR